MTGLPSVPGSTEYAWVQIASFGALVLILAVVGVTIAALVLDLDEDVRRDVARSRAIVRHSRFMARLRLGARRDAALLHHAGPVRLQQRRVRGWLTPDDAIRVGHGTRWGNPWRMGDRVAMPEHEGSLAVTGELAVALFVAHVTENGLLDEIVEELRGHDLVCWCKTGQVCHGEWLLEVANRPLVLSEIDLPVEIYGYTNLTHVNQ